MARCIHAHAASGEWQFDPVTETDPDSDLKCHDCGAVYVHSSKLDEAARDLQSFNELIHDQAGRLMEAESRLGAIQTLLEKPRPDMIDSVIVLDDMERILAVERQSPK